jgi:D-alanyl-D-alanine carboxypeptidase
MQNIHPDKNLSHLKESLSFFDSKIILNIAIILSFIFCACSHRTKNWEISKDWEAVIAQNLSMEGSIDQVDDSVISFMKKYNVPGLSLAISKNDKLIYVKAYGYADVATGEKVTTQSLFRIGSISKPFTSVAIMKLIQEGKLSINSKVFGDSGVLKNDFGNLPYGPDITSITINELLHHTCGGWTNDKDDPMFMHPSFNSSQLLSWTLNNQPLKNHPDSVEAYSNFGYFVLGRVIEKITGQPYADYVKNNIMQPIRIKDMQIGKNSTSSRIPNEVVYYGQWDDPYSFNLSRMDANGGWIASATDLIRLVMMVNRDIPKRDILDSPTINLMFKASKANPKYACGWAYYGDYYSWGHNGGIPGSASDMEHTKNGFTWAILLNTRSSWDDNFYKNLENILKPAINDSLIKWSYKDLY